jgi:methylated-DNA-[protein]-cysteine S-methyltransferase
VVIFMKIAKVIGSLGSEFAEQGLDALLRRSRARVDQALKQLRRPQAAVGIVKSPLGDLLVAMTGHGIAVNHYLLDAEDLAVMIAKMRLALDLVEDLRAVKTVGEEVRRYLGGEAAALRQKIDLTLAVSPFQKKVLHKLQEVPRGAVISYQALGAAAGAPQGARAVGNAMHNNPVPIYVPCHRVIAANGRIGGYGGGIPRKLQLLRSEGFALADAAVHLPDDAVWGHTGTKIYCRNDCRTAARVNRSRVLFFADAREARQAGMRPCKICQPA